MMDLLSKTFWVDVPRTCDIIGELQGSNIYNVTDQILFYLDCTSLKNASLVSKGWRKAVLVALHVLISREGNPCWSVEQIRWWREVKSHLANDFHFPVEDSSYTQRLANSVQLATEQLQLGYFLSNNPGGSLDYLPYGYGHLCRIDMNEKYIVAWDPETRLWKCWSRRTLSSLPMDQDFQIRNLPSTSLDEVENQFHLSGNYLCYAKISEYQSRKGFTKLDINKVHLPDATHQRVHDEQFSSSIYVESPMAQAQESEATIKHFLAFDDIILLLISFKTGSTVKNCFTALWKLEQGESKDVVKVNMLHLPLDVCWFFCDKDYVVTQWSYDSETNRYGFRTYSIHPPKSGGKTMELRFVAYFDIDPPLGITYKHGILLVLTSSSKCRNFTFMDVVKGTVLKKFDFPWFFLLDQNMISMTLTRNFMIFFEKAAVPSPKGTNFYACDMRLILRTFSTRTVLVPLIFIFNTLTSSVRHVLADDFGIVAVVEDDPSKGIQVLSFLPACSHCKRLTKPALLKRCNVCKSVAYCSEECETADWNPHHMGICSAVKPFEVSSLSTFLFSA